MFSYASQTENSETNLSHFSRPRRAAAPTMMRDDTAAATQANGGDFSRVPLRAATRGAGSGTITRDKDPPKTGMGSGSARAPAPAPGPAPAQAPKRAGVDTFKVTWKKEPTSSATKAQLRIDFVATFKNDATHDPALADFRQSAFHKLEITEGPHKGIKENNSPLHDDHYSRADDVNSNPVSGTLFEGYDNPGVLPGSLDKDDVIDYSFTAQQMIIDTSDNNKVLQTKGPHTATIKGKHPRRYEGVPKAL